MAQLDTLVLGQRVRAARRRAGLTLAELGEKVARPAPYLSLLENGKVEPKIGLIGDLADALDVLSADLLDPAPPNRRAELEIDLERLHASRTTKRSSPQSSRRRRCPRVLNICHAV